MTDTRTKLINRPDYAGTYRIVRFYQGNHPRCVIRSGLSRAEAQAHCNDPETSSSTAKSKEAQQHTTDYGAWFDGYQREADQ